jgi:formylglycine-generating enzyme required for sulfatase activity
MKNTRILPLFLILLGAITFLTSCNKDENLATSTVTTESVYTITVNEATCRGFVDLTADVPFTSCGICWSTTANPTLSDSVSLIGSSLEEFSCTMHHLISDTHYYVRAFAETNSKKVVYGDVLTFQTPKIPDLGMVTIPGGTYTMGGLVGDIAPKHSVTISTYQMGSTEVTQAIWKAIMGQNPSTFTGDALPVETVNIADIQSFLTKLNLATGKAYRLPTEAEWEYAAKGGLDTTTLWAGTNQTDSVSKYMWNSGNSLSKTHTVASKKPNTLGLYDMCGNVWEWCSDWYGTYSNAAQTDPTGQAIGYLKVIRGGSWSHDISFCNVQNRNSNYPEDRKSTTGFRLVLVP